MVISRHTISHSFHQQPNNQGVLCEDHQGKTEVSGSTLQPVISNQSSNECIVDVRTAGHQHPTSYLGMSDSPSCLTHSDSFSDSLLLSSVFAPLTSARVAETHFLTRQRIVADSPECYIPEGEMNIS